MALADIANELAEVTRGIDWDGNAVAACRWRFDAAIHEAPPPERDEALAVLVERIEQARLEDCDGVSHAVLVAGALVEHGASAAVLAATLVPKLPTLLAASRRYADACLAELVDDDEKFNVDPFMALDLRGISLDVFRRSLADDGPGGIALAYLSSWTDATVAALTRDRDWLRRAQADARLVEASRRMRDSPSYFLDVLLGVTLDETWRVLCPLEKRGFECRVDGVATNFDLNTLLADALVAQGLPGERNPADVIAKVRGERVTPSQSFVHGTYNLYTFAAAGLDLAKPHTIPDELWIWNEGAPRDVPLLEGRKTLVVGPPPVVRTWNMGPTFSALRADVEVLRELSATELRAAVERASAAVGASQGSARQRANRL